VSDNTTNNVIFLKLGLNTEEFSDIKVLQLSVKISRLLTYLLTYSLTPWSRVLLEKLTGSQLVKKFPAFYGTEFSLPYSQVPATCPYPEPTPSSPQNPLPLPERPSLMLSSHLRLGLPNGLLPSGFPTRTLCTPHPC